MKRLVVIACLTALPGCRGSAPESRGTAEGGFAAVLIGARARLAGGGPLKGAATLTLESEGGRHAQVYRLELPMGKTILARVQPGDYRLMPERSLFGTPRKTLVLRLEGRRYEVPFPRDILRRAASQIRAERLVSLGVLEVTITPSRLREQPEVKARLDDSTEARRRIVQDTIGDMLDSERNPGERDAAVSWSRALERSLLDIQAEQNRLEPSGPADPAPVRLFGP